MSELELNLLQLELPQIFLFSTNDLVSALNNGLLSKIMYHSKFENSRNRRFTSSIESYLGLPSFLPDLFPRLNSIQVIQPYYKEGPGSKPDVLIC